MKVTRAISNFFAERIGYVIGFSIVIGAFLFHRYVWFEGNYRPAFKKMAEERLIAMIPDTAYERAMSRLSDTTLKKFKLHDYKLIIECASANAANKVGYFRIIPYFMTKSFFPQKYFDECCFEAFSECRKNGSGKY